MKTDIYKFTQGPCEFLSDYPGITFMLCLALRTVGVNDRPTDQPIRHTTVY